MDRTVKVRRPVRNVIGLLKGSDPALQAEAVIVGAHYDHLGRSGRFSMSQNSTGQIHHGADDNASGTAAVIEMAKAAAEARKDFRRSLVFMTFAGEEHGLLGSSYYVNHPDGAAGQDDRDGQPRHGRPRRRAHSGRRPRERAVDRRRPEGRRVEAARWR